MTLEHLPKKIKNLIIENNDGPVLYREEEASRNKTEENKTFRELPRQLVEQYNNNLSWQIILANREQNSFIIGIELNLKSDNIVIGYRLSQFHYQTEKDSFTITPKAVEELYKKVSEFYDISSKN